jgi:hypothetical protein
VLSEFHERGVDLSPDVILFVQGENPQDDLVILGCLLAVTLVVAFALWRSKRPRDVHPPRRKALRPHCEVRRARSEKRSQNLRAPAQPLGAALCTRRDLNPHTLRYRNLNPVGVYRNAARCSERAGSRSSSLPLATSRHASWTIQRRFPRPLTTAAGGRRCSGTARRRRLAPECRRSRQRPLRPRGATARGLFVSVRTIRLLGSRYWHG